MIVRDGWKYFILASCDVEGNFLVVKVIILLTPGFLFELTNKPGIPIHYITIVHAS